MQAKVAVINFDCDVCSCQTCSQPAVSSLSLQGTIAGHEHLYQLDADHKFITGKPTLVSGNTAAMVGEGGTSWLSNHFEVNPSSSPTMCPALL